MELNNRDLFRIVELILYKKIHLQMNELPEDPKLDLLLEKINYEIAARMVNGECNFKLLDELMA